MQTVMLAQACARYPSENMKVLVILNPKNEGLREEDSERTSKPHRRQLGEVGHVVIT